MIATVAAKYLPYAWVAQICPGGRIVAPSWALDYCGLLLVLTVDPDGTASGHFVDDVSFMMLRNQRDHRRRQLIADLDRYEQATRTETELHPADVADYRYSPGAVLAIGTHQWWVAHGRPDADRWRCTVTVEGQRIELDSPAA